MNTSSENKKEEVSEDNIQNDNSSVSLENIILDVYKKNKTKDYPKKNELTRKLNKKRSLEKHYKNIDKNNSIKIDIKTNEKDTKVTSLEDMRSNDYRVDSLEKNDSYNNSSNAILEEESLNKLDDALKEEIIYPEKLTKLQDCKFKANSLADQYTNKEKSFNEIIQLNPDNTINKILVAFNDKYNFSPKLKTIPETTNYTEIVEFLNFLADKEIYYEISDPVESEVKEYLISLNKFIAESVEFSQLSNKDILLLKLSCFALLRNCYNMIFKDYVHKNKSISYESVCEARKILNLVIKCKKRMGYVFNSLEKMLLDTMNKSIKYHEIEDSKITINHETKIPKYIVYFIVFCLGVLICYMVQLLIYNK